MKTVVVLNGPNLNMLGQREPDVYGSVTLADIEAMVAGAAKAAGVAVEFFQSNHEGALVDKVQSLAGKADIAGLIVNAGAYTHTSVALHDALRLVKAPIIEVHLSNPMARESFRHTSYIAPLAKASICGLGAEGYLVALRALTHP